MIAILHARFLAMGMKDFMSSIDSPSVRERRLARDLREVRIGAEMAGQRRRRCAGVVGVKGVPDRDRPDRHQSRAISIC